VWYVNYNVSTRLSHEWKWFRDYATISPIKVYVQDNSTQEAIGRGNIKVLMSMGENNVDVVFINVLHVLDWQKPFFYD
jgi:hypothetical protein